MTVTLQKHKVSQHLTEVEDIHRKKIPVERHGRKYGWHTQGRRRGGSSGSTVAAIDLDTSSLLLIILCVENSKLEDLLFVRPRRSQISFCNSGS